MTRSHSSNSRVKKFKQRAFSKQVRRVVCRFPEAWARYCQTGLTVKQQRQALEELVVLVSPKFALDQCDLNPCLIRPLVHPLVRSMNYKTIFAREQVRQRFEELRAMTPLQQLAECT